MVSSIKKNNNKLQSTTVSLYFGVGFKLNLNFKKIYIYIFKTSDYLNYFNVSHQRVSIIVLTKRNDKSCKLQMRLIKKKKKAYKLNDHISHLH